MSLAELTYSEIFCPYGMFFLEVKTILFNMIRIPIALEILRHAALRVGPHL